MAKPCTRLPLLERFPQHVRQKANQNVRLDTSLFVMPNRTDAQIGFLNTEGSFGFSELNVGLPQLFVGPVVNIAAQDVSAFSKLAQSSHCGRVFHLSLTPAGVLLSSISE